MSRKRAGTPAGLRGRASSAKVGPLKTIDVRRRRRFLLIFSSTLLATALCSLGVGIFALTVEPPAPQMITPGRDLMLNEPQILTGKPVVMAATEDIRKPPAPSRYGCTVRHAGNSYAETSAPNRAEFGDRVIGSKGLVPVVQLARPEGGATLRCSGPEATADHWLYVVYPQQAAKRSGIVLLILGAILLASAVVTNPLTSPRIHRP